MQSVLTGSGRIGREEVGGGVREPSMGRALRPRGSEGP